MERKQAEMIDVTIRFEARNYLLRASNLEMLPSYRCEQLTKARNTLHRGCVAFEDDGGSELHEDLYLPLFDALAFVNDALRQPDRVRERITQALFVLDAAPVKGGVN